VAGVEVASGNEPPAALDEGRLDEGKLDEGMLEKDNAELGVPDEDNAKPGGQVPMALEWDGGKDA